ncbi:hypothetical protein [Rhodophyticola sp.]
MLIGGDGDDRLEGNAGRRPSGWRVGR